MGKKANSKFKITHLIGDIKAKIELYSNPLCPAEFLNEASILLSEKRELSESDVKLYTSLIQNPYTSPESVTILSKVHERILSSKLDVTHHPWTLPDPTSNYNHQEFHNKTISKLKTNADFSKFFLKISSGSFLIMKLLEKETFLAGNSLSDLILSNYDINDFDFFFKTEESAISFLKHVISLSPNPEHQSLEVEREGLGVCIKGMKKSIKFEQPNFQVMISKNAITFVFKNSRPYQFITRIIGTSEYVTSNFDFAHCKCSYDLLAEKLVIPPSATQSLHSMILIFEGGMNPVSALLRARKFESKRWTLTNRELFKIAYAISQVDLSDPAQMANAVSNFYGESVSEYWEKEIEGKTKITFEDVSDFIDHLEEKKSLKK